MSEIKHTPGPWEAMAEESGKSYVRIRGTRLGGHYKIANVLKPIYAGADELEAEETAANACLIAAAPELLNALTILVNNVAHAMPSAEHLDPIVNARAAIAKATGA
jgi:hypothetical protein